ncbi:undecaprenyl diphosphate synthase family protein [Archaeoglobus sp.]
MRNGNFKINTSFFIIDGNRREAKKNLLIELYHEDKRVYKKLLDLNPSKLAESVDSRIKAFVENGVDRITNPDNLSLFSIPLQKSIREIYYRVLLRAYVTGAEKVTKVIKEFPAKNIVIYGLSLDNLNRRPWQELKPIMDAMLDRCDKWIREPENKNIQISTVGEMDRIEEMGGEGFVQKWREVEEFSKNENAKKRVYILLAYDHGEELKRAVRCALENGGKLDDFLEVPNIDVCIRTGGEKRLSGGPMYQMRNAELIFDCTTYWPSITSENIKAWVKEYLSRNRREGA